MGNLIILSEGNLNIYLQFFMTYSMINFIILKEGCTKSPAKDARAASALSLGRIWEEKANNYATVCPSSVILAEGITGDGIIIRSERSERCSN